MSKSSIDETISKTVLPHFSKDIVAYIPMTSLFTVTTKIIFSNMLKLYVIRLLLVYWSIFNKTLWLQNARKMWYHVRNKTLWRHNWRGRKKFFSKHTHVIYHLKGLSMMIVSYWKTMIWKSHRKKIFHIFFSSVKRKNLKQGTMEIHFFKHAQITDH